MESHNQSEMLVEVGMGDVRVVLLTALVLVEVKVLDMVEQTVVGMLQEAPQMQMAMLRVTQTMQTELAAKVGLVLVKQL